MSASFAIIYANLKGNLGDFAILEAMLWDIEARSPGCTIDVYSHGFVPVDKVRLAAFQRAAPAFDLAGTTFVDNIRASKLTKLYLSVTRRTAAYQGARVAALAEKSAVAAAAFARYQAIYLAGGAQFTGEYSGISMLATLRAIAAHNDRIFSYPISVTPSLLKRNDAETLRQDLGCIQAPIIARDSTSEAILRDLGLRTALGPDCVFSLANVAKEIPPARKSDRPRVLLAVTNQEAGKLSEAVAQLNAAGMSCALLSTCELEDAADQMPIARAAGIEFLAPCTWQEAVAEMKAATLVIANRLHGLILASFCSVPVLPLSDRSKVKAVVDDMGLPISVPDVGSINTAVVNEARHSGAEIVARIAAYAARVQSERYSPIDVAEAARRPPGIQAPN